MSFAFVLLGLGASVGLTAFGLVCQTRGLKDGNSVVVCTCGNVSQDRKSTRLNSSHT